MIRCLFIFIVGVFSFSDLLRAQSGSLARFQPQLNPEISVKSREGKPIVPLRFGGNGLKKRKHPKRVAFSLENTGFPAGGSSVWAPSMSKT